MASFNSNVDCEVSSRTLHATPSLVLGILSIICTWPIFFIGLPLGIIGLIKARAGSRELQQYPQLRGGGIVMAGRLCSIVGTVLNGLLASALLLLVVWIVVVIIVGQVLGLPVE